MRFNFLYEHTDKSFDNGWGGRYRVFRWFMKPFRRHLPKNVIIARSPLKAFYQKYMNKRSGFTTSNSNKKRETNIVRIYEL